MLVNCTFLEYRFNLIFKDQEEKNGSFFKNDDDSDLSSKIANLLNTPEQLGSFEKESLRIIKEEVNEKKVVEGYVRMFKIIR